MLARLRFTLHYKVLHLKGKSSAVSHKIDIQTRQVDCSQSYGRNRNSPTIGATVALRTYLQFDGLIESDYWYRNRCAERYPVSFLTVTTQRLYDYEEDTSVVVVEV